MYNVWIAIKYLMQGPTYTTHFIDIQLASSLYSIVKSEDECTVYCIVSSSIIMCDLGEMMVQLQKTFSASLFSQLQ